MTDEAADIVRLMGVLAIFFAILNLSVVFYWQIRNVILHVTPYVLGILGLWGINMSWGHFDAYSLVFIAILLVMHIAIVWGKK